MKMMARAEEEGVREERERETEKRGKEKKRRDGEAEHRQGPKHSCKIINGCLCRGLSIRFQGARPYITFHITFNMRLHQHTHRHINSNHTTFYDIKTGLSDTPSVARHVVRTIGWMT